MSQSLFIKMSLTMFMLSCIVSCGPKAFVKGDYDDNVQATNLLNDRWSESDMQQSVKDLVDSLVNNYNIASAKRPPLMMVTNLQNKTEEHIDTQNIMDMVRVELMNRGRVSFVDKEARGDMADEYKYQEDGTTSHETKKHKGKQTGADFILNGRLDSIVQDIGKDKSVYYKLTLNMTNLESGVIVWSNYKQIRMLYKKKSVGL
jgi:uncharacterized protein (TIGR02722 family)